MAAERFARCPSCASVYRVSLGSLQQAQGWLRCGQCQQPFDATGCVVVLGAPDEREATPAAERLELESLLRIEDRGPHIARLDAASASGPVPAGHDELLAFERALASFPMPEPALPQAAAPASVGDDWAPEDDAPLEAVRPRWSRRAVAAWLALSIALLVQTVWATRAQWAVHWPWWGQWAQAACDRLGCAWVPWHEPRVLALEHAQLRLTNTGHRLQWDVRNQASWPVAMPALELTLLDDHGQVLLRRVLSPAEQQSPLVLSPLAHWSGDLHWQVPDDLRVAGYRLWVFYP